MFKMSQSKAFKTILFIIEKTRQSLSPKPEEIIEAFHGLPPGSAPQSPRLSPACRLQVRPLADAVTALKSISSVMALLLLSKERTTEQQAEGDREGGGDDR